MSLRGVATASRQLDLSCEGRIREAARPLNIKVMTGLDEAQFDALVDAVGVRVPFWSAGRPFQPGLRRSVLIVLVLLRQNLVQRLVAAIFGTSQSTVSRRLTTLRGPICDALAQVVPDPDQAAGTGTVLIDGTLAPTCDWQHREDLFSGKHMKPGFNLQVAALLDGTLIGVGAAVPGAHHDVYAWHECGLEQQLAGHDLLADLGYVGVAGIHTGTKRRPGGRLTPAQRAENRAISSTRATVERVIAHLKHWKILGHPYRGPLDDYRATAACVTALEFYRLTGHPLNE